ncbi:MAG: response regulator transcription factor [Bacteroidota bacterium]
MTNRNQQMPSSIMDETKETIRVMLVDDHQIVIDGLKSLLAEIKNIAIVAEANNGKDAIEILSKTAADIVIIDIEMPIMNGWDATKIITSRYPQTKVIALTTFSEKAIIKKMLNAGASGYILKNIKKDILLEAIIAVHNGEKYFSSEISLLLLKPSAEEIIVPKKQNSSVNLLTSREVEILKLIAGGLSNAETAEKLFISPKTVKAHRENIMKKLDLHNVVDLVRCAIDSGFID